MSFSNRKFSLDSSFTVDQDRVLVVRRGSRFGSKKSKEEDARLEIQEHDLNANEFPRRRVSGEDNPERPEDLVNSHSFQKLNKSFHKLFSDIPEGGNLIQHFTFALQKEVLYHGKLFVSETHVCFHSSVLLKDTRVVIPVSSIKEVKKHNAALSMLTIQASNEKYSFVSLRNRDTCYRLLQWVCVHAKRKSPDAGPQASPAEAEVNADVVFSSSSLEENTDQDLSKQDADQPDGSFPHMQGAAPTACSPSPTDDHTAASWLQRVLETASTVFLLPDFQHISVFVYIYVMLLLVLLLVSGYIGLRIVALEEQLNSLGALSDLSLRYREYQET